MGESSLQALLASMRLRRSVVIATEESAELNEWPKPADAGMRQVGGATRKC